jgi:hypothetical protein
MPLCELELKQSTKMRSEAITPTQCLLDIPCEIVIPKGLRKPTFILINKAVVVSEHETSTTSIDLQAITVIRLRTCFHHMFVIDLLH